MKAGHWYVDAYITEGANERDFPVNSYGPHVESEVGGIVENLLHPKTGIGKVVVSRYTHGQNPVRYEPEPSDRCSHRYDCVCVDCTERVAGSMLPTGPAKEGDRG